MMFFSILHVASLPLGAFQNPHACQMLSTCSDCFFHHYSLFFLNNNNNNNNNNNHNHNDSSLDSYRAIHTTFKDALHSIIKATQSDKHIKTGHRELLLWSGGLRSF